MHDFIGAMQAIGDGRLNVAPLHTGTFGLFSLQDLFEEPESGNSEYTKVLITPNDWGRSRRRRTRPLAICGLAHITSVEVIHPGGHPPNSAPGRGTRNDQIRTDRSG